MSPSRGPRRTHTPPTRAGRSHIIITGREVVSEGVRRREWGGCEGTLAAGKGGACVGRAAAVGRRRMVRPVPPVPPTPVTPHRHTIQRPTLLPKRLDYPTRRNTLASARSTGVARTGPPHPWLHRVARPRRTARSDVIIQGGGPLSSANAHRATCDARLSLRSGSKAAALLHASTGSQTEGRHCWNETLQCLRCQQSRPIPLLTYTRECDDLWSACSGAATPSGP